MANDLMADTVLFVQHDSLGDDDDDDETVSEAPPLHPLLADESTIEVSALQEVLLLALLSQTVVVD